MNYSTAAAATSTGISVSTLRNYTVNTHIAPLLSESARPAPGKARRFTAEDLTTLSAIYRYVANGSTLEDAARQVSNGILLEPPSATSPQRAPGAPGDTVDASTGIVEPPGAPQPFDATSTTATPPGAALVLRSVYERMNEQHEQLWQRCVELERTNARLQAELTAARRPPWWSRLATLFHR